MDEFSPIHWLIVLIIVSLFVPVYRILKRMGFSGMWCVLSFVPLVNLVGLWTLAFIRWPAMQPTAAEREERIATLQKQLSELQKN